MKIKIFKIITISLILFFIFLGCEKNYDNIIENYIQDYQVSQIILKDSIEFPIENSQIINITFNSVDQIQSVFFDIYSPDNSKMNGNPLYLIDDGSDENGDSIAADGKYSAKVLLDSTNLRGNYLIELFVKDFRNFQSKVAVTGFYFDNGQGYFAPVLSNLVLVDSIQRGTSFSFTVDVYDSNGLGDVAKVYYELYTPDGSQVSNSQGIYEFPLFDDGNTSSTGDINANDGTYTIKLTFPTSVTTGLWRFEFSAIDRKSKLSNKIIRSVKVI